MPTAQIAQNAPFTRAECAVIDVWAKGNLMDKEAARALQRSYDTVKDHRYRIAEKAQTLRQDAGHLLLHLHDKGWIRLLTLTGLILLGNCQQLTDISHDDLRRTSSRIRIRHKGGKRRDTDITGTQLIDEVLDQLRQQLREQNA